MKPSEIKRFYYIPEKVKKGSFKDMFYDPYGAYAFFIQL